jgi:hypothetical protein
MKLTLSRYEKQKIARAMARKVDLLYNEDDFQVCLMGSLGMSTKAICESTGLSHCQVTYRLNKAQVSRAQYRNGTSAVAKELMKRNTHFAAPIVKKEINKRLKELS